MSYTVSELITAILGSAGAIGGLLAIASFIASRLDKRRERKHLYDSVSVELEKVELEKNRFREGSWESIAHERGNEIAALKAEMSQLRESVAIARRTLTKVERTLDGLTVAQVPDEVVAIIQRKLAQIRAVIAEGKDKLG